MICLKCGGADVYCKCAQCEAVFLVNTEEYKLNLWEVHHFYWALISCLAGWFWIFLSPWQGWVGLLLGSLGSWWLLDDLWQHWRQRREPEYRSPVHRIWIRMLGWLK